jgi:uncharacterized membrane protein
LSSRPGFDSLTKFDTVTEVHEPESEDDVRRLPADRLTLFSDAVVAIAITLLVLPLVDLVPEAFAAGEDAAEVLTKNLVPIGTFLLSFVVIWRIWSVHHQVFARASTVSSLLVRINVVWLACIVALPFPVEMIGFYGGDPVVTALYVGILLVSAGTLAAMALVLRRTEPDQAPRRAVVEQVVGNAAGLALALVLVLAVPQLGFWPLILLFIDTPVRAVLHRLRRGSRS